MLLLYLRQISDRLSRSDSFNSSDRPSVDLLDTEQRDPLAIDKANRIHQKHQREMLNRLHSTYSLERRSLL